MRRLDEEGRLYYTDNGIPRFKQYLDEMPGVPLTSLWTDIQFIDSWTGENTGYPTQKPEALLERIVRASSDPEDKDKNNKLVWPEPHDYLRGTGRKARRFKSDLIPASILVDRYFAKERDAIAGLDTELAAIEQELEEMIDEHSGDDGLLSEVIEGEDGRRKITKTALKERMKEVAEEPHYEDEREALKEYAELVKKQDKVKKARKAAEAALHKKIDAKYPDLSEDEVKTLVVDDKWIFHIRGCIEHELDRVSHRLTERIRVVSERYFTPLPELTEEVADLAQRVEDHLRRMGASWK